MSMALDLHRTRLERLGRMSISRNTQTTKPPPAMPWALPYIPVTYRKFWFDHWCKKEELATPTIISVPLVMHVVCEFFNISKLDLLASRRKACDVRPRQIAMYLAKTLTLASLPRIGNIMNRDHTTVLHAVAKMEKQIQHDAELATDIAVLRHRIIKAAARQSQ